MARLNRAEIARLAREAGVPEAQLPTAVAVALAESGGDTGIVRVNAGGTAPGSRDRGLWQINDRWHPEVSDACAFDPVCATREAVRISKGGTDWSPWNAYKSGAYRRFLEPALKTVYAWTPYFTETNRASRRIAGVVLHDTETDRAVPPHSQGSWHYEIDRDGTILAYVDEADVAWHVRATDEWHPAWLPKSQPFNASAANCHTVGIELVSSANLRDPGDDQLDGGPYTEAQYAALHALLADLYDRLGVLPIVSHGALQLDRTDPVAFDYARAGLVWAGDRYLYEGTPEVDPADKAILDVMHGLHADANSVAGWINEIGALREENGALHAELDELRSRPPVEVHAPPVDVAGVLVRLSDGREVAR